MNKDELTRPHRLYEVERWPSLVRRKIEMSIVLEPNIIEQLDFGQRALLFSI